MRDARNLYSGIYQGMLFVMILIGMQINASWALESNAALFYYQALIECPLDRPLSSDEIRMLKSGSDISDALRQKMKIYRETVVRPVEVGTQAEYCKWGLPVPSSRSTMMFQNLHGLGYIVWADAHLLLWNGDGEEAIKRCVTLHQLACHVGLNRDFSLWGLQSEFTVVDAASRVLNTKPVESHTLSWLRTQLEVKVERSQWLINSIRRVAKDSLYLFEQNCRERNGIKRYRSSVRLDATDTYKASKKDWDSYSDDELHTMIRDHYANTVDRLCLALTDIKPPYEPAFKKIYEMFPFDDERDNPLIVPELRSEELFYADDRFLNAEIRMNALKAAIDIYLIQEQTGELPRIIPPGLPTNPCTNEPFKYTVKDDGFVLSYTKDGNFGPETKEIEFNCPVSLGPLNN